MWTRRDIFFTSSLNHTLNKNSFADQEYGLRDLNKFVLIFAC